MMFNLSKNTESLEKKFDLIELGVCESLFKEFAAEMKRGLSRSPDSSLAMFDSFIRKSVDFAPGNYLGLDLSGTNFRVVLVKIGDDQKISGEPKVEAFKIPDEIKCGHGSQPATSEQLFRFIAQGIREALSRHFQKESSCHIGFTFAFPMELIQVDQGKLTKWTKRWNIPDLVGKDPVNALREALNAEGLGHLHVNAILNDTVGTLVLSYFNDRKTSIGGILGTGSNIAGWIDGEAINFESGNYDLGSLRKAISTPMDELLDQNSNNPGEQILEKMVGGKYLGELMRLQMVSLLHDENSDICSQGVQCADLDPLVQDAGEYAATRDFLKRMGVENPTDDECRVIQQMGAQIVQRSAQISAVIIASAICYVDPELKHEHWVAIDGSLFEHLPGYQEQMRRIWDHLLNDKSRMIQAKLVKDGSGIGAALVSSIVFSSKKT